MAWRPSVSVAPHVIRWQVGWCPLRPPRQGRHCFYSTSTSTLVMAIILFGATIWNRGSHTSPEDFNRLRKSLGVRIMLWCKWPSKKIQVSIVATVLICSVKSSWIFSLRTLSPWLARVDYILDSAVHCSDILYLDFGCFPLSTTMV